MAECNGDLLSPVESQATELGSLPAKKGRTSSGLSVNSTSIEVPLAGGGRSRLAEFSGQDLGSAETDS
jgi:hypothetical protein